MNQIKHEHEMLILSLLVLIKSKYEALACCVADFSLAMLLAITSMLSDGKLFLKHKNNMDKYLIDK